MNKVKSQVVKKIEKNEQEYKPNPRFKNYTKIF